MYLDQYRERKPTVRNVLDCIHDRSDDLERLMRKHLGDAKVTSYVDGVTKIELPWKSMLLLRELMIEADRESPV